MKILVDLTSLADNFSGIERYAACLTKEMLKNKKNKYILLFKNEIHFMFVKNINDKNVEMVIIPGCKKLFFNQVRLPLEIYKYKADLYIFMAFPVPILLFKKNMVSTIHDICCWDCPETMNGLSNYYFRVSHRIAMLKCKKIVTISMFSENRIVKKLKYPRDKIWLVYCGVDGIFLNYKEDGNVTQYVKKKYNLADKYLLSLSTLEPRKNLGLLVEAYRKLVLEGKIDIPLVLAGRKGWKMDEFLSNVEDTVKEKIVFTGFIDNDDLPVVYGNSCLFIFPSMYEGFGMPPLEALACGTPVLSSDAASLPEVLGDAVTYFKNMDMNDLMIKLERYKNYQTNKDLFKSQVNKFSWESEADKFLHLINETR